MEDSSTANQNPNELGTELTDEQMTEFVDNQIGPQPIVNTKVGYGNPDDAPVTTPPAAKDDEEDKGDEKSKDDKAKTDEEKKQEAADKATKDAEDARKAEEAKKAEEAAKPGDIPAVDTSDLWVEVEAYVLEGEGDEAKPVEKTVRISLDAGEIPDNVRFKNDKQLMEVLDSLQEMRQIRTQRNDEHDAAVAKQEEADNKTKADEATLAGWRAEDDLLVESGLLDAPKAPPADGKVYTAEEIVADPALELRDNVYKFMTAQNEKRLADGKTPIPNFTTAFNMYNKEQTSKTDEEKAKTDAELTKKRGALVGGGSGAGTGPAKTDKVYRAGSAKSIWAVPTDDL